jgi:catalase
VSGNIVRQKIDRTNDFKQPGDRYRIMEDWEKDDLIANLTDAMLSCDPRIQEKMINFFTKCDPEYGSRIKQGVQTGKSNGKGIGGPMGATNPGEAVRKAESEGHSAKPY